MRGRTAAMDAAYGRTWEASDRRDLRREVDPDHHMRIKPLIKETEIGTVI
jgi:hypothetical protein